MANHPYGYALYEPESSAILKPGVLGYLTEDGKWAPLIGDNGVLIDLGEPDSLLRNGLNAFNNFSKASPDQRTWGPKTSKGIKSMKVDLKADASLVPAGIPANVGALYTFQSVNNSGAILMTKDPVTKNFVYGDRPLRTWCKENSQRILTRWPDVKDRGVIVVTSTYTTAQADINAWEDKQKTISVGFRTGFVNVMEVAPSSDWYTASSDNGWITSKSPDNEPPKVVFFGGLYFKYNRLALPGQDRLQKVPLDKLRGADPESKEFELLYEDFHYGVACEEIGIGEVLETPPQGAAEDEDEAIDF